MTVNLFSDKNDELKLSVLEISLTVYLLTKLNV